MDRPYIPFNLPTLDQSGLDYVGQALKGTHRHGAGPFTARARSLLEKITGAKGVVLTHSGTGALEMSTLLIDLMPGDEVIMPSYTFSSTANAVVLRGAVPVFADIEPKSQCLDPDAVAKLINSKTKAILPVHYAGVGCDMQAIQKIAKDNDVYVIEDAAQAVCASRDGKALGCFGELGALSFHDSKNISSGEGGALLINDESFLHRAEILWEKGTNRSQFLRGEVDKYTWVDLGSSFLPSEVTAAFLLSQLERSQEITAARMMVWNRYYDAFAELEEAGFAARPFIPANCTHNAHIFYLMLNHTNARNGLLSHLKEQKIGASFHYVPLHNSPAGIRYGLTPLDMPNTMRAGDCLIRFPLFPTLGEQEQKRIIQATNQFFLNANARVVFA
jgi:dTDP-4-amino-4,6-dideoxygalactose transaminase